MTPAAEPYPIATAIPERHSLYLRYRPQRFCEIRGQEHVVKPLLKAVSSDKVGHAYLLYGPRGTGKTTTARVLAKALNCLNPTIDHEPCCECESCISIQNNNSFDLIELDAASNNKVEDMRGLLDRVAVSTPGKAKIYLLDEAHMLTPGAENALLKTLEEPPEHVIWILATTEPSKIQDTIKSRCQVFELRLLPDVQMETHLQAIVKDAELELDNDDIQRAISEAGGSVRDALSALDRYAAGGVAPTEDTVFDDLLEAIADHDEGSVLSAVEKAVVKGRDVRVIIEETIGRLRQVFLQKMGSPLSRLSQHEQSRNERLAGYMPTSSITHALEVLGKAGINMRQAPDPRVDLDVAMIRICRTKEAADRNDPLVDLERRVARLEDRMIKQADTINRQIPATGTDGMAILLKLTPDTAQAVIDLAQEHLGLPRETVIDRANALLGPRTGARRTQTEIQQLWNDLVRNAL